MIPSFNKWLECQIRISTLFNSSIPITKYNSISLFQRVLLPSNKHYHQFLSFQNTKKILFSLGRRRLYPHHHIANLVKTTKQSTKQPDGNQSNRKHEHTNFIVTQHSNSSFFIVLQITTQPRPSHSRTNFNLLQSTSLHLVHTFNQHSNHSPNRCLENTQARLFQNPNRSFRNQTTTTNRQRNGSKISIAMGFDIHTRLGVAPVFLFKINWRNCAIRHASFIERINWMDGKQTRT